MIERLKNGMILLAVLTIAHACEKSNTGADIYNYRIIETVTDGFINTSDSTILLDFSSGFASAENLTAEFSISEGATAMIGSVIQVSGVTANNYEKPLALKITAEDGNNTSNWQIIGINNDYTYDWGLGGFLENSFSRERDYDWYLDQGETGQYKYENCGPTSTVMAAKWSDRNFTQTPVDARSAYHSDGGWWYTDDISNYLTDYGIPHTISGLGIHKAENEQIIRSGLDNGFVVLLCLDMYYITATEVQEYRVDKFYYTGAPGWGHFIIVKGCTTVDGNVFFEVYDPYSMGKRYYDGSLKGKNRYYRSEDIYSATRKWWNYVFLISEKNNKKSHFLTPPDLTEIEHSRGR
ncbi:MAG: hypothetical protein JW973_12275 [Bacteroidales bacterium]|nr:hypothetical protein [Bacteroidales bacterium]